MPRPTKKAKIKGAKSPTAELPSGVPSEAPAAPAVAVAEAPSAEDSQTISTPIEISEPTETARTEANPPVVKRPRPTPQRGPESSEQPGQSRAAHGGNRSDGRVAD